MFCKTRKVEGALGETAGKRFMTSPARHYRKSLGNFFICVNLIVVAVVRGKTDSGESQLAKHLLEFDTFHHCQINVTHTSFRANEVKEHNSAGATINSAWRHENMETGVGRLGWRIYNSRDNYCYDTHLSFSEINNVQAMPCC